MNCLYEILGSLLGKIPVALPRRLAAGICVSASVHASTLVVLTIVQETSDVDFDITRGTNCIEVVMDASASASATEVPTSDLEVCDPAQSAPEVTPYAIRIEKQKASTSVARDVAEVAIDHENHAVALATSKRAVKTEGDGTSTPLRQIARRADNSMPTNTTQAVAMPAVRSKAEEAARWDKPPSSLPTNPSPRYPASAIAAGQQGTVILQVTINSLGTVDSLGVHQSSGVAALDVAAVETVRLWRFQPASGSGLNVEATVRLPITFRLE